MFRQMRAALPLLAPVFVWIFLLCLPAGQARAQDITGSIETGASGLPLPRFASLKSSRINMRAGPGRDYRVEWNYRKAGLPMEIIQEYDNWRKVRDASGDEGWIHVSLLTGKRTGVAAPWQKGSLLPLRRSPGPDAPLVAQVEAGAVGDVISCDGQWCIVDYDNHEGYMRQAQLWGVYPSEQISD
ncbi:SH3 domain-containing protein [Notoacmeibacter sp. MSK16QG-6]|uniref:SH3 domain-containing protein n=1 Tax=Notoacmeibacter sp. MSK16QG-6 TaxID=2957982 RepID=UPI00209CB602|nr:SH3 domain-containing protein [Notoacmeibacter sp. MSK16QG-6]MCP1198782.1 SH3 domain-containing protein [Notoacmeibacter sp. MSK16QG-6]